MKKMLEICVDSLASARNAIAGGADRLELCSALAVGGLTPYTALLRQIRRESNIPIRCLMRHRPGDFLYTADEIELLNEQIIQLKQAGASGFVIGCLTPDGMLDKIAMRYLIESCGSCGVTLHRCIDVSADPGRTYCDAMELGVDTVLTSGCASSCLRGIDTIKKLIALRDSLNGPEILIGAGVNSSAITQICKEIPAARAFHMSGKSNIPSAMRFRREGVPMGLPGLDEWHIQQTDKDAVIAARRALDK
ncbi:MAG: copper homeostasis protein CutC [Clostridia bacterium]|nr:copper homeostasis protein CutC [Clostridia bacterium]